MFEQPVKISRLIRPTIEHMLGMGMKNVCVLDIPGFPAPSPRYDNLVPDVFATYKGRACFAACEPDEGLSVQNTLPRWVALNRHVSRQGGLLIAVARPADAELAHTLLRQATGDWPNALLWLLD